MSCRCRVLGFRTGKPAPRSAPPTGRPVYERPPPRAAATTTSPADRSPLPPRTVRRPRPSSSRPVRVGRLPHASGRKDVSARVFASGEDASSRARRPSSIADPGAAAVPQLSQPLDRQHPARPSRIQTVLTLFARPTRRAPLPREPRHPKRRTRPPRMLRGVRPAAHREPGSVLRSRHDLVRHLLRLGAHLAEAAADEPLGRVHRAIGVQDRLPTRHLPHQTLAGIGEGDHRRCRPGAFRIGDHPGLATSYTAITEFVVPRSMPTALAMIMSFAAEVARMRQPVQHRPEAVLRNRSEAVFRSEVTHAVPRQPAISATATAASDGRMANPVASLVASPSALHSSGPCSALARAGPFVRQGRGVNGGAAPVSWPPRSVDGRRTVPCPVCGCR